jgi:hypothetical protein
MSAFGPEERLLQFYDGTGTDDRGRRLEDIWSWEHPQLEAVHDFIQWMFPTRRPSGVNPLAPLVTDEVQQAFARSVRLRNRLRQSLIVMLDFYGLERRETEEGPSVARGAHFELRSRNWLTHGNHNHLRITRILTSLRILGLSEKAQAFVHALAGIYAAEGRHAIARRTWGMWRSAAGEPR